MLHKWILPGIWVLLISGYLEAQTSISPNDILRSAFQDQQVVAQQNEIDFRQQIQARLPFLDEISLRSSSRNFDIYQQDFLTRISVNGIKEQSAYQKWQHAETNIVEATRQKRIHYALYERYQQLSDFYAFQREIPLQQELLLVYADKIKLIETKATVNADADPEALMKTEFDRDELLLRIAATQSNLVQKKRVFTRFLADDRGNIDLDTSRWITPDQMFAVLNHSLDSQIVHPSSAESLAKIGRISAEYNLENARNTQVLDFLQLRYRNQPGEPFRNDASIGVGINIPWNGSRTAKKTLLKIDQYAAEQALETQRDQLRTAVQKSFAEMSDYQQQRTILEQQIKDAGQRYNLQEIIQSDKKGIETVLLQQEYQIRRRMKRLALEKEITERYLEILFLTGYLSQSPRVNFLNSGLNNID